MTERRKTHRVNHASGRRRPGDTGRRPQNEFLSHSPQGKYGVTSEHNQPRTCWIPCLQDTHTQITGARKAWQRQIWELEGQVRDLRAEMEEMRAKERSGESCAFCGRGGSAGYDEVVLEPHAHDMHRQGSLPSTPEAPTGRGGVVNRPRARTGVGGRFGAAT